MTWYRIAESPWFPSVVQPSRVSGSVTLRPRLTTGLPFRSTVEPLPRRYPCGCTQYASCGTGAHWGVTLVLWGDYPTPNHGRPGAAWRAV